MQIDLLHTLDKEALIEFFISFGMTKPFNRPIAGLGKISSARASLCISNQVSTITFIHFIAKSDKASI